MIDLIVLCSAHFIADIALQPREMGKEKSEDPIWMLGHFLILFVVFFIAGTIVFRNHALPPEPAVSLALVIACVHCMQDWFLWVLYKCHIKVQVVNKVGHHSSRHTVSYAVEQWQCIKDYWFFFTIGIDQYLHYILIVVIWGMFIQGG